MITNVKLTKNGYSKIYAGGKTESTNGDYQDDNDVKVYIENGGAVEAEFTANEIEAQRVSSITAAATRIIEARYTPLKQRKMMSVSIGLLSAGESLTQDLMIADEWISSIRAIENLAIVDNTLLADIVWE